MLRSTALCAALPLLLATATHAQPKKRPAPPPCLREPAPKKAPELALDEVTAPLPFAVVAEQQRNGGGATIVYRLRLSDAEMFADRRVDIGLQVKKGETLAGRTFEQHAGLEMKEQPDVLESEQGGGTSWSPRVYGVTVTSEKDEVRYDHGVASTVRVSFGQPAGGQLPGTVQLCIAAGQRDDTFQKTPTRAVRVTGAFKVDVSKLKAP